MNPHQPMMLAVFSLIFVVSCVALKSAKLFGHPARVVISVCVAALCVLSLFKDIQPGYSSETVVSNTQKSDKASPPDHSLPTLILLPFLVLIISVPVVLLLALCAKLWRPQWPKGRRPPDKHQIFNCSSEDCTTGTTTLKNGKIYEP